jgi:hypothetical protein
VYNASTLLGLNHPDIAVGSNPKPLGLNKNPLLFKLELFIQFCFSSAFDWCSPLVVAMG